VIYNILEFDWYVGKLILDMKQQFLDAGGSDLDFPDWLSQQGIEVQGPEIHIDDALVTLAKLKFGS
jgi:hypothetical protein